MMSLHSPDVVLWQEPDEDVGVPEPAIAITAYSNVVCLTQEGKDININWDSINDLCKLLKGLKRPDGK